MADFSEHPQSDDQDAEPIEEWTRLGHGVWLIRHTAGEETTVFWAIERPEGTYRIGGLE